MASSTTQLYDNKGRRKYLTAGERERFLKATKSVSPERRTFCLVLLFTGCRISEALQFTVDRIDVEESVLVLETLKRRKAHQRTVPVSSRLIEDLKIIAKEDSGRLWGFSRRTGWRIVKAVMAEAGIQGIQACPKGLRHGFGISSAENNVPISKIQAWMGHASIQTTMIYLDAVGKEERRFAERTWLGY